MLLASAQGRWMTPSANCQFGAAQGMKPARADEYSDA